MKTYLPERVYYIMDEHKEETKAAKGQPKDNSKKKIAELTDKLSKEHDDYIRLMAEFETFRRRSA